MKRIVVFVSCLLFLTACATASPQAATQTIPAQPTTDVARAAAATVTAMANAAATATEAARPTETNTPAVPTSTPTLAPTPTPDYPAEGRGPTGFAENVNPLTGLEVDDPNILNRRPVIIKVENLPRNHRPQFGLSLSDIMFEYYTEFGATRFAAIFYGQDASRVGPIRSGRFFDTEIVEAYKGVFIYGSAYEDVRNRFARSSFWDRLIIETTTSCPALCRYGPNGEDLLVADTAAMQSYLAQRAVNNARQSLDGMFFQAQAPAGGEATEKVFVRYSGAIYNRWDYDAAAGNYLRFVDADNDINRTNEVYVQLTDGLTSEPITAENVVMLCAPHQYYVKNDTEEVLDIYLDNRMGSYVSCDGKTYTGGSGAGYVARDGQIYPVTWKDADVTTVVKLYNPDGTPFALKPGQTWFEVIGASSSVQQQEDGAWRFTHRMVP